MDLSIAADVIKGFFTGFFTEMKFIPHNSLSVLALWVILWGCYMVVWPKIVIASDIVPEVRTLQTTMEKLNATLIVDKMDRRIRDIDNELYTVRREIDNLQAKKLDVPESLWRRSNDLDNEKKAATGKLFNFTRNNSKLLEQTL